MMVLQIPNMASSVRLACARLRLRRSTLRLAAVAYVVVAAAMGLIVLCFAQAGSRVSLTGGPYAYVEIALGKYVGFLVGTLLWLVGTTATAAVGSAFIGSIAVFWAPLAQPVPRALILALVFLLFGALNIRGTRQSTRFLELVT